MTADDLQRTYMRFAHQILEPYDDPGHPVIIGMQTRGVYIGRRIREIIGKEYGKMPDFGVLDVTFYRDDFRSKLKMPEVKVTEIPVDLYDRDVVLVVAVVFPGIRVRSALGALVAFGGAVGVGFCCMVARGSGGDGVSR